jgi:hypothetical protein
VNGSFDAAIGPGDILVGMAHPLGADSGYKNRLAGNCCRRGVPNRDDQPVRDSPLSRMVLSLR